MLQKLKKISVWKALALCALAAFALFSYFFGFPDFGENAVFYVSESDPAKAAGAGEQDGAEAEQVEIVLDISGAVASPGVYHLPEGSRLYELIDAAGGLLDDADLKELNRAALLVDGQKIYVRTTEERKAAERAESSASSGKININTAGAAALQRINGVGPATAARIIAFRTEHGPFERPEDLTKVSGIGPKTYQKMKDQIRVN
jgi:competence protein ComEA